MDGKPATFSNVPCDSIDLILNTISENEIEIQFWRVYSICWENNLWFEVDLSSRKAGRVSNPGLEAEQEGVDLSLREQQERVGEVDLFHFLNERPNCL